MDHELGVSPPHRQRRLSDCNLNSKKVRQQEVMTSNLLDYSSGNGTAGAMTCSGHASSSSCSEIMHDSGDYQWCLEYAYNREYNNGLQKKLPKSVLSSALLDANEVSYDDLSKNIDANLAEIDMEDFRSEDIHSILSLPAMICADGSHVGEKFASASNSILQMGSVGTPGEEVSAFESASSNRSSSENDSTTDMSICKDEPLFSPMKEQAQPVGGAISTDSLDCSGFEEPDLVLTCRANKNNYTIAFEGSSVQFSDDSDYLEGAEGTGSSSGQGDSGGSWQHDSRTGQMIPASVDPQGKGRGDMIQSDMVFTTWSKLRRLKETTGRRQSHHQHMTLHSVSNGAVAGNPPGGGSKSQSLPNLLRQSVMLAEIMSNRDGQQLPIYDIQNSSGGSGSSSQLSHSRDSDNSDDGPLNLLKLFIQQRGQSSLDSSSQSEASSSLGLLPPMLLLAPPDSHFYDLLSGRELPDDTEKTGDTETIFEETNNNNIHYTDTEGTGEEINSNNNNNPLPAETGGGGGSSEESSSQCFEDSLVEVPPLLLKGRALGLPSSPIKEEEEQAGSSSGDETMRDLKDPFSSDSNTTEDIITVAAKNININNNNNGSVGGNVFPTNHNHHKLLNIACCTTSDEKLLPSKNLEDLVPASLSTQGTQTGKGLNQLGVPRQNRKKGEGSSRSSSRCSSSQESLVAKTCWSSTGSGSKRINVSIATTRSCGTQIPVHIRDQEVQTCSSYSQEDLSSESQPWSFTLREDDQDTDTDDDTDSDSDTEEIGPVSTQRLEMREAASSPIEKKDKKSIYVCYPNYSLPDLSFLRNVSSNAACGPSETVVLNPTGRDRSSRQPAQRRSLSSEGRTRPKSCADADRAHNFGHIRDWESLKVLLPDEIRQLITSPKEAPPSSTWLKGGPHYGVLRETPSVLPPSAPLVPKRSLSLNTGQQVEPPARGILRKSSSAHQCSTAQQQQSGMPGAIEEACLKRRSLQEPFHCLLDNIPESQKQQRLPLPLVNPREPLLPFVTGARRCSREEIDEQEEDEDLREVLVSSSSLAMAHNLLTNKNYNPQTSPLSSGDVSPQQQQPPPAQQQSSSPGCNCCMRHRKSVSFCREGEEDMLPPVKDKAVLLKNLKSAVLALLEWFDMDLDNFEGSGSPTLETVVLDHLCPALSAILFEGLVPRINGLFGPLPNSPWRIADASCQGDNKVHELQELVAYVNGESILKDTTAKFNAFILGLLNLKHLEQWLLRLLSSSDLLQQNYSSSCSLLLGPACLGWQQALISCVQPLGCLSFHCDLFQAATVTRRLSAGVSPPASFGPPPERKGSYKGRRHPLSCVEGNQRYPVSGSVARTDGGCCHPSLGSPCEETKVYLGICRAQDQDGFDEDERILKMMLERKEEPSTSADSGCSCSIPNSTPNEDIERNEIRFQELRNKWEQMGNSPSETVTVTVPGRQVSPTVRTTSNNTTVTTTSKPPTGRIVTPEISRRGQQQPASVPTRRVVPPPAFNSAASERKVVMRSKLPSPARPQTPDSRPQTPESPQRNVGATGQQGSGKGQTRGRPGVIRKSLIPVHTPAATSTGAKVKRASTQQPIRPPNRNSNL